MSYQYSGFISSIISWSCFSCVGGSWSNQRELKHAQRERENPRLRFKPRTFLQVNSATNSTEQIILIYNTVHFDIKLYFLICTVNQLHFVLLILTSVNGKITPSP